MTDQPQIQPEAHDDAEDEPTVEQKQPEPRELRRPPHHRMVTEPGRNR